MTRTATHLTRCPFCEHTFAITEEQLGVKSGYARCANCEKIFSAIDNILTVAGTATPAVNLSNPLTTHSPSAMSETKPTASSIPTSNSAVKPSVTTAVSEEKPLSNDTPLLFDDHLGIVDEDEEQPKSTNKLGQQTDKNEADFEIIDNFDSLPMPPTASVSQPTASKKDSQDEAWLTQLLEQENKQPDPIIDTKLTPVTNQTNDVTLMLEDLGVGVKHETAPNEDEYQKKLEQRLSSQVASQRRLKTGSGMTMVWAVGSLLLGLALWVQYTLFNMNDLVKDPVKAGHVATLCSLLSCKPPLADTKAIDVRTLSLTSASDAQKSDMILSLKNTTQQTVLFPNLKVTLRQGNETKAQFVLTPNQYTEANNTTLLPEQIQPLKLRIDYPKSKFEQANIDVFY